MIALAISPLIARAASNFDLDGPPLNIRVTRNGETLPIAEVPDLKAGDRLWLHPDLPKRQDAHYLLVTVFLRGSTNPPPDGWFVKAETWTRQVQQQGVNVTIPQDAGQALFFLAPETGGDFSTLRTNVRAKPGIFVRASQDLNQASLDRSRLDAYVAAVTQISEDDPAALMDASKLLGRSLNIKVDSNCFQKPAGQQLACLTQNEDSMVLDDGHTQSMVASLTSGASADLIGQLSSTPMAGGGAYSPYVGAIVDVVRIMNGIHTAQYEYIPALATANGEQLQLKINNPPSFINPKSVLTVGLPAVGEPKLPPMKAVGPDQVYCLESSPLVLPVDGAPLVYSTKLAHDFVLHVAGKEGGAIDLPAKPDAVRGGFLVDTHGVNPEKMDQELTGTLRGYWGFEAVEGPSFRLESAHKTDWKLTQAQASALIVGRSDTLHLDGTDAACVRGVSIEQRGKIVLADYKLVKPDQLDLEVGLQDAQPGAATLLLQQAGLPQPDRVQVQAYSEGAHLESFSIHAGDPNGELQGSRLDEISGLEIKGEKFTPGSLERKDKDDLLTLTSAAPTSSLKAGEQVVAQVTLKDGRQMSLPVTVLSPRPSVTLLNKTVNAAASSGPAPIHLADPNELPLDASITFVLQSANPWKRGEKIEVGSGSDSAIATLSIENGGLTLQDDRTVLANLNPLTSFGSSAFGPVRFRPIDESGTAGNWQPLGNLVRFPALKEVRCPFDTQKNCTLVGSNLFLLDSVSAAPNFSPSMSVAVGFAGSQLEVPRPNGTVLYIKLRDDPSAINAIALPVLPE